VVKPRAMRVQYCFDVSVARGDVVWVLTESCVLDGLGRVASDGVAYIANRDAKVVVEGGAVC